MNAEAFIGRFTLESLNARVEEIFRLNQIEIELLTERQVIEAFKQALLSGDFQRHVRAFDGAQAVVYMPFAETEELRSEIDRLKKILDEHGISHKVEEE